MSDIPSNAPPAPICPSCASPMALKQAHKLQPQDHFIFKCPACLLEYPVIGGPGDGRSPKRAG